MSSFTSPWRHPLSPWKTRGSEVTSKNAGRVGVFIGSGVGGFATIEREHEALLKGGPRKISPFFIPATYHQPCIRPSLDSFWCQGPEPWRRRRLARRPRHRRCVREESSERGQADVMIAGGSEAAITPMGIGGFAAMRTPSQRNGTEPERAFPGPSTTDYVMVSSSAKAEESLLWRIWRVPGLGVRRYMLKSSATE